MSNCANLFQPTGTCIVRGLTATAATRLVLENGAILRLNPAANAKLLTISANGVQINGTGTLDCNDVIGSGSPEPIFAQGISGLTIRDLTIENSANYGIHTVDCSQVIINNATLFNCALYSIALYTTAQSTQDYEITNCRVDRSNVAYDSTGAYHSIAILNTNSAFTTSHGLIEGNLCIGKYNASGDGIGITLFCTSGQAFLDWDINGNSIENGYFGISVGQGYAISVVGNSVYNHKAYGIEIVSAQASSCTGNSILGGSVSTHGIVVDSTGSLAPSVAVAVAANSVEGCTTAGIYLAAYAYRCAVTGNTIEQTSGSGLLMNSGGTNVASGNIIDGAGSATGSGIDGTSSLSLRITGNILSGWSAGTPMTNIDSTSSFLNNGYPVGSVAWTPGSIGSGLSVGTVVTTTGSEPGDISVPTWSTTLPAGVSINASANTNNSQVNIVNSTNGNVTIAAGTAHVAIWRP